MVKRFKFIIQKLYRIRLAGASVIGVGPYKLSQTDCRRRLAGCELRTAWQGGAGQGTGIRVTDWQTPGRACQAEPGGQQRQSDEPSVRSDLAAWPGGPVA